jgi:hypothetical protein
MATKIETLEREVVFLERYRVPVILACATT